MKLKELARKLQDKVLQHNEEVEFLVFKKDGSIVAMELSGNNLNIIQLLEKISKAKPIKVTQSVGGLK